MLPNIQLRADLVDGETGDFKPLCHRDVEFRCEVVSTAMECSSGNSKNGCDHLVIFEMWRLLIFSRANVHGFENKFAHQQDQVYQ